MGRYLPDAEVLVCAILRDALPDIDVVTLIPPDLADRPRPLVWVRRIGGSAVHPQFLDRATVDIQCWGTGRRQVAGLAEQVRSILWNTHRAQTARAEGSLASYQESSAPAEIRTGTQSPRLYRYQATYSLGIRPPHS
ncbi:hypothetical protein NLX83_21540 [Allokutzneria sp. A3M-2-11 16]|uniref:phage tail termination protein n=1 Tax=Allokutzneria sp. A3M-2-11 16 TaxID=2962043 RepID=UPI0020B828F6|nr:hypothetical protein [Allokutzneria sp. A3M-2-11 16]MCP3801853.1 hypothetical protein [Allokutzneria sp. A3M-2-11 16]